ncbi:MAG: uncharacterized protein QOK15_3121 [Nocardioidaceae bacterium]|nr:uncharacterized protein [Nocardioidaceae bacterium]
MSRTAGARAASLSAAEARRVTLAAQGFLDRPHTRPTARTLMRTVGRTGVLQIDSVNVLQRAHYMPLFSRMGSYDTELLDRASGRSPRRLVEYWAHVAAFMPVDLWPHMRHRMRRYAQEGHPWMEHNASLVDSVLTRVGDQGPRTARELDDGGPRLRQHWGWNWSETKKALEYLFFAGELAVARRNSAFERVYDLPERVLPRDVLGTPEPTTAEAHRELVRRAARSYGVATARDLADYFRMPVADTQTALVSLVESGELVPVTVEGWGRPAYLHAEARVPRRVDVATLLSPFDPVVWERARTERLFGFHYRIEIYVPAARRVHGYYVLPFLLGDRLAGRVDLKADRAGGTLLVNAAHAEVAAPPHTGSRLASALWDLARWLDLPRVVVSERGNLSTALIRGLVGVG